MMGLNFFDNPLFIVSNSRSGSTAVKLALGCHPQIVAKAGEAPLLSSVAKMAYLIEHDENAEYFKRDLRLQTNDLKSKLRRLCIEVTFGSYFGSYFLGKIFFRKPLLRKKMLWCTKTFPNFQEYTGLITLFPRAKFILLIRNGVDQISSTISCWPGKPFEEYCIEWRDQFVKYAYAWGNPNFLIIKHEEMVETPELVMERIFEFCKIPYDPKPANYLKLKKVNTTKETMDETISNYLKNRDLNFPNWSQEEKDIFIKVCGATMDKFNYPVIF